MYTEGEKVLRRRARLLKELGGWRGYRLYVGAVPCSLTGEITDGLARDIVGSLSWVRKVKVRLEKLHPEEVYVIMPNKGF